MLSNPVQPADHMAEVIAPGPFACRDLAIRMAYPMPPRPAPRRAPPVAPVQETEYEAISDPAPPSARVVVRPDTIKMPPVAKPAGSAAGLVTTTTTTSNGDQLEAQLDGLLKPTTVEDLVRTGKTQNLKTLKESQLRELIRQAVSTVMARSGGADEETLDRIQAELKRTLAERAKADNERQLLVDRLAKAEGDLDIEHERIRELLDRLAQAEAGLAADRISDGGERQILEDRLAKLEAELATERLDLAAARARQLEADGRLAQVETELRAEHERAEYLSSELRRVEATAEQTNEDFLTAQSDLHFRDDELATARKQIAELQIRIAALEGKRDAEPDLAAAESRLHDVRTQLAIALARADQAESRAAQAEARQAQTLAEVQELQRKVAVAADTIARLETELAERIAQQRAPAPAKSAGGAFLAAPGRPRATWRTGTGRGALETKDGAWRSHGLALPGGGAVVGWHRPADASDHVLAVDESGRPVELVRTAGGKESIRRLDAPASADARLSAAAVPAQDVAAVVVRSADGRIHLRRGGEGRWEAEDLTAVGHAPPAAGAPVVWFWGRENSWHIAYPDAAGILHELFELSGRWYYSRLADGSGAPACAGGLTADASDRTEHVLYRGSAGSIHLLSYDGHWRHRDAGVTGAVGVPSGAELPGGYLIVWRDSAGSVRATIATTGGFATSDLGQLVGAPAAAADPQIVRDGDGAVVVYPGSDGRLVELAWNGGWRLLGRG